MKQVYLKWISVWHLESSFNIWNIFGIIINDIDGELVVVTGWPGRAHCLMSRVKLTRQSQENAETTLQSGDTCGLTLPVQYVKL